MTELRKLTDQIDQLLAEHRYEDEGAWYDGREETLVEVRKLAAAHQEAQRKVVDELAAIFVEQAKVIEDARFELSRGVLDLIQPRPEQTLAEIVAEVVKFKATDCRECEAHVCECDCDSTEDLWEVREGVKGIIKDLKGLL